MTLDLPIDYIYRNMLAVNVILFQTILENMYCIYSRISREILDKIWPKFYQFDLYACHKNYHPKCIITMSCTFKNLLLTKNEAFKF
jgi:hypothetical protein